MDNFRKIIADAGIEVISLEAFAEVRGDVNLLKSMSSLRSFKENLVGKTLALIAGEKDANDIWDFELMIIDDMMPIVVSQYQMKNTSSPDNFNLIEESVRPGGVVVGWKFTKFEELKVQGQIVLPKGHYREDVIASQFKLTTQQVRASLWGDWNGMDADARELRKSILAWCRNEEPKKVIRESLLTAGGNLTAAARASRYGTLHYEIIERLKADA